MAQSHRWTFFRAGGFDQVKLESGADLQHLEELDQKLWVALACPTNGLELDARTLALIDTDRDNRVRAPELIAAVKFACANLKDPDALLKGTAELPLSAIDDKAPQGKLLRSAARQILTSLGRSEDSALTPADFAEPAQLFANSQFNGDGIITEDSADDEPTRVLIREVADCIGTLPDRSGKPGVGAEQVNAFFDEIAAYAAWHAEAPPDSLATLPLGPDKTAAAWQAFHALRAKIEDYFTRCRLAAFDARAAGALNRKEEDYAELAALDLSAAADRLSAFPLAEIAADKPLPLSRGTNPAYSDALKRFRDEAVVPLLGPREVLTLAEWRTLSERLGGYDAWVAGKRGARVEKLGIARVRELEQPSAKEQITALITKDQALAAELGSIENVERLVRYYRDLHLLCENFVNFKDFYSGSGPAVFQCGTLYLDQRTCSLCLRVEDAAKHALLAGLAGAYLAYLDCTHKSTGETMQIVAAVTNGGSDNLMVGRNGIFYDRHGKDWDATITKVVDNPISLRQAFWSPYKRLVRLIEEQVAKRAAAADDKSHGLLDAAATAAANADKAKQPVEAPKQVDVGAVAALGVAVGAIGTFATAMVGYATGLFKMGPLAVIGAALGVMLLISMPSVVVAYIKLHKRNLAPILDANGWAVNAHARINGPFGATLTAVAKLPPGSRHDLRDAYAESGLPWKRWVLLAIVLYAAYEWYHGAFDRVLPEGARSLDVLGNFAPLPPAKGD